MAEAAENAHHQGSAPHVRHNCGHIVDSVSSVSSKRNVTQARSSTVAEVARYAITFETTVVGACAYRYTQHALALQRMDTPWSRPGSQALRGAADYVLATWIR